MQPWFFSFLFFFCFNQEVICVDHIICLLLQHCGTTLLLRCKLMREIRSLGYRAIGKEKNGRVLAGPPPKNRKKFINGLICISVAMWSFARRGGRS